MSMEVLELLLRQKIAQLEGNNGVAAAAAVGAGAGPGIRAADSFTPSFHSLERKIEGDKEESEFTRFVSQCFELFHLNNMEIDFINKLMVSDPDRLCKSYFPELYQNGIYYRDHQALFKNMLKQMQNQCSFCNNQLRFFLDNFQISARDSLEKFVDTFYDGLIELRRIVEAERDIDLNALIPLSGNQILINSFATKRLLSYCEYTLAIFEQFVSDKTKSYWDYTKNIRKSDSDSSVPQYIRQVELKRYVQEYAIHSDKLINICRFYIQKDKSLLFFDLFTEIQNKLETEQKQIQVYMQSRYYKNLSEKRFVGEKNLSLVERADTRTAFDWLFEAKQRLLQFEVEVTSLCCHADKLARVDLSIGVSTGAGETPTPVLADMGNGSGAVTSVASETVSDETESIITPDNSLTLELVDKDWELTLEQFHQEKRDQLNEYKAKIAALKAQKLQKAQVFFKEMSTQEIDIKAAQELIKRISLINDKKDIERLQNFLTVENKELILMNLDEFKKLMNSCGFEYNKTKKGHTWKLGNISMSTHRSHPSQMKSGRPELAEIISRTRKILNLYGVTKDFLAKSAKFDNNRNISENGAGPGAGAAI